MFFILITSIQGDISTVITAKQERPFQSLYHSFHKSAGSADILVHFLTLMWPKLVSTIGKKIESGVWSFT